MAEPRITRRRDGGGGGGGSLDILCMTLANPTRPDARLLSIYVSIIRTKTS